tara:strand:- start:193 stop:624 length:432 start_codon:yes stop_codon:yes gene_type:complete
MKCPPGTVKATRTIPSKKTGGSPKVETYCKVIGGTKDKKGPKSPYKMYGKTSSPLEGGSPLAKYGCSKKHSPLKAVSDEKAAEKFTRKSNRQYEKSKKLESKGKYLRAAKADMKSSYYMTRAKDLQSSNTSPNTRYIKRWKNK